MRIKNFLALGAVMAVMALSGGSASAQYVEVSDGVYPTTFTDSVGNTYNTMWVSWDWGPVPGWVNYNGGVRTLSYVTLKLKWSGPNGSSGEVQLDYQGYGVTSNSGSNTVWKNAAYGQSFAHGTYIVYLELTRVYGGGVNGPTYVEQTAAQNVTIP
jgi:hypothetical protein